MSDNTIKTLLEFVSDSGRTWSQEHEAIYRSCFVAGVALVSANDAMNTPGGPILEGHSWPPSTDLRDILIKAQNDSSADRTFMTRLRDRMKAHNPNLWPFMTLMIAQQRIAAGIDRTVNLALDECHGWATTHQAPPTHLRLYWQNIGARIFLLLGFMRYPKEKDRLNAFYEAFNEFTDNDSAASALDKLVRQVRTHRPAIENIEQVLECLAGPASSFTVHRSLAFVDMRVNAHKHLAHGVSQNVPRPRGIEWCITVNAYRGLTDLVDLLHFGKSHDAWTGRTRTAEPTPAADQHEHLGVSQASCADAVLRNELDQTSMTRSPDGEQ